VSAGERPGVSSGISAVLSSGSVICTLGSGTGVWRHPKVPIRWNLPRRRRGASQNTAATSTATGTIHVP
jgi:hypothetical protein